MKRKPQSAKNAVRAGEKPDQPGAVSVPASYAALLTEIRERVRNAQLRAHLAVNGELVLLYWQIGWAIVSRQKLEGWGKSVIERLAADIQKEFPGIEGFSTRNIWRMRAFYLAYAQSAEFLPAPLAETGSATGGALILPAPLAELRKTGFVPATPEKRPQPVAELPPPELLG